MNEFDFILDEYVEQVTSGASTLDKCLARHPGQAAQLKPLLQAALRLERGRAVAPSPAFKARARAQLTEHMKAHPRHKHGKFSLWRIAIGMAAIFLAFLMTGTTFAQSALPGDRLYDWKLNSEDIWRAISLDPLGTDLDFSNRRVLEIVAVSSDEDRRVRALEEYKILLTKFEAERDTMKRTRISSVLKSQQESLKQAGLAVPELDHYFLSEDEMEGGTVPLQATAEMTSERVRRSYPGVAAR
ncbi:MAG: hypothetical protein HZB19_07030 [Chloroflexi bacterium]|nr:hypothetical protein [Chloroflexota bacterium]